MSIQTITSSLPSPAANTPVTGPDVAPGRGPDALPAKLAAGLNAEAPTPAQPPQSAPGVEQIREALEDVQQTLAPVARNLLFSLDEDSGKTIVKVVDSSTDEVIRQIPSEEIVAISKALDKLQGLLLKQQA